MNFTEFFSIGFKLSSEEQKKHCEELIGNLLALPLEEQKIHCKVIGKEIDRLRKSIFEQSYDEMMFANHLTDVLEVVKKDWPFDYEIGDKVQVSLPHRKIEGKVIGFERVPFRLVNIAPIDNVYKAVPSGKCGFTTLSLFS